MFLTVALFLGCGPEADPVAGEEIYREACVTCHGEAGDLAVVINEVPAPVLADIVPTLDDDTLVSAMVDGRGAMPPSGLSDDEAADCVAWLRVTFP